MKFEILIFVLHLFMLSQGLDLCPSFCSCDLSSVQCSDENLTEIPSPLPPSTTQLSLPSNRLTRLTKLAFDKTGITKNLKVLNLMDNQITKIESSVFEDMISLKELYLLNNTINKLSMKTFEGLKHLQVLDLSRNKLKVIENKIFHQLVDLMKLHLWGNDLERLEDSAFYGLINLETLTLGDNKLMKIPSESFTNLQNLQNLELLNLPIQEIQKDAFKTLKKLKKLHISNWSSLRQINQDAFVGLSNLTYLSLISCSLNKLSEASLSPLTSLKQLNLAQNPNLKLKSANFRHLKSLEELYLSHTGLHSFQESPFSFMTSLRILDLSNNRIDALPSHLFFQLDNLVSLNISNNNLKTVPHDTLEPLQHLHTIDVTNNPIVCDCNLKWLRRKQETKIRDDFGLKGTCRNPNSYNNTLIVAIPLKRFSCDAPKFKKKSEEILIKLNMRVVIDCIPCEGNPQPDIDWDIKFSSEDNQNKHKLSNGSLLIDKVEVDDLKTYQCIAKNEHGIIKHTIKLIDHIEPNNEHKSTIKTTSALVVLVITMIGLSTIFGLVCYKRKSYSSIRRNLASDSQQTYSHF